MPNSLITRPRVAHNPADYTVNAVLAFPFGTVPDYGIIRNSKTDETIWTADTERYNVSIDGTPIDKQLRHTFSLNGSQFELNRDVSMLHSSYMDDEFYDPDLPVTQYTFVASNVDTEIISGCKCGIYLLCRSKQNKNSARKSKWCQNSR